MHFSNSTKAPLPSLVRCLQYCKPGENRAGTKQFCSNSLSLGNENDDDPWNLNILETQFYSHQLNHVNGFKATDKIKRAMLIGLC